MKKLFAVLVALFFATSLALPGLAEAASGDDLSQPGQFRTYKNKKVKKAKKSKKAKNTKKYAM